MATVNFLYRSRRDSSYLVARLLFSHNDINFVYGAKTQFMVDRNYWIKQHKKKSKLVDIQNKQFDVNFELKKINDHIINAFNSVKPEEVSKLWLQSQLDNYYNPLIESIGEPVPTELVKYFDYYIDNKENYPSEVLKRKIRVVQKKVARFQTYLGRVFLIKDVNKDFKNKFSNYCEAEKYSRITTQRDFAEIKTICVDARSKGIETSLELDKLSFKREKATNIYLSVADLEAIEDIAPDKLTDSLSNARDWLVISAYVGQRISDFMRFTDKMIRVEDGESFLEFTQKKTNKLTTIPLHPKVLEILKKRNGMFPYSISDQKYNDYIKTVCEIAELTEMIEGSKRQETTPNSGIYRKVTKQFRKCDLVSSHIGRRSFATNFYGIIPTSHLINITNHSSEVQFLAYLGKSNKDLAKETFKYFKKRNTLD